MKHSPEFKEGKSAAKNGARIQDNPYKTRSDLTHEGVLKYKDWLDGFLTQRGFKMPKETQCISSEP